MEREIQQLVQSIHDEPPRIVMVTAGAGTQALSDLLSVAGATRTLLEALVPYSETSFDEFLGQAPEKYVTGKTANLLAGRALTRARWLETEFHPVIGLACTATIVTDRPKRGEHRAYIATWQAERLVQYGLHLDKGRRDRTGEENLVSRLMLNALARAFGLHHELPLDLTDADRLTLQTSNFEAAAQQVHQGKRPYFSITPDGRIQANNVNPQAMLSGAFNPLHEGHLQLLQTASDILDHPVIFECAAVNVDKPPLAPETIIQRSAQFAGRWPITVSNAPTFLEKARLFPGTTFVVGYDTAVRIIHPRYYGDSTTQMLAALDEIRQRGCSFLVAGRADENGKFQDVSDLELPEGYADLFTPIPAERFRHDISSTELRQTGQRGSR